MPKNKPNHITVFINDVLKPEILARGEKFVFSQLIAEAADRFKLLSEEEKTYYKSKAKTMKPVNVTDQFFQSAAAKPSVDTNSSFVVKDLKAEMLKIELAAKEVHERIQAFPSLEDLRKKEFIFASVQCFLEREHVRPVEIAMVKWSMKFGVVQQFHSHVNPGEIPIGLRSSLKEFAKRTHMITEDLYDNGEGDYEKIWLDILNFITCNGVMEPTYSFDVRSCHLVSLCFDWLRDQVGSHEELKVDPVENLLRELFLRVGHNAELSLLKDFLAKYNFDLSESLRCDFHAQIQCEFCALAFCKKPAYNVLASLSRDYGFELTENHRQVNKMIYLADKEFRLPSDKKDESEFFSNSWSMRQHRTGKSSTSDVGGCSRAQEGAPYEPASSTRSSFEQWTQLTSGRGRALLPTGKERATDPRKVGRGRGERNY